MGWNSYSRNTTKKWSRKSDLDRVQRRTDWWDRSRVIELYVGYLDLALAESASTDLAKHENREIIWLGWQVIRAICCHPLACQRDKFLRLVD
jgi:hypothetical protein